MERWHFIRNRCIQSKLQKPTGYYRKMQSVPSSSFRDAVTGVFPLLNVASFDGRLWDCFGVVALLKALNQWGECEQSLVFCNSFEIICFHLWGVWTFLSMGMLEILKKFRCRQFKSWLFTTAACGYPYSQQSFSIICLWSHFYLKENSCHVCSVIYII